MVISTVTNASTTTVESALPTTTSARTLLAPEEIFTPSSSDPRARSELAPNEKRTLRNKMKKSNKKRREAMNNAVDKVARMKGSGRAKGIGGVKKQKEEALQSVVKIGRGVTVVGKKVDKKAKQVRKR
jgi:U3 small nucleolar RNA-associated protein MPP10